MSQSLYRKYRSRTFDELVGQEHVTRTLRNAVNSGKIAHAYLFCGPRGTGKTSTARLLAKSVNCTSEGEKPCNECEACRSINEGRAMDLIEIDAASRRKVEDISEIIDRVNFAPAELRYKVYIIDEVHMLTAHAFNALLKTLEEPPDSAIFVLATTEVWKVLPTIVSRCQRFDFRRIPTNEVVSRLKYVAEREELRVQPEALAAIARVSTGSLRDALGLLDQLTVFGSDEITLDLVQSLLGTVGIQRVSEFVDAIAERDAARGLELLRAWEQEGMDPRQFTQELVEYLRNVLMLKVSGGRGTEIDVTHEALESMKSQAARADMRMLLDATERFSTLDYSLRTGPYGYLPIELALVATTTEPVAATGPPPAADQTVQPRHQPTHRGFEPAREQPPRSAQPEQAAMASQSTAEHDKADEIPAPPPPDGDAPLDIAHIRRIWPRVLNTLGATNRMLLALLRESTPVSMKGNIVDLNFKYEFHRTKVDEAGNRAAVEQALSKVLGRDATIRCTFGEGGEEATAVSQKPPSEREQVLAEPRVKAALNIFNGKIVEINGGEP